MKEEGYFELVYAPRWKYTSVVRNFVQDFLAIAIAEKRHADKIALAASELVENSVKYSDQNGTKLTMWVAKSQNRLNLNVQNHASEEQINILRSYFEEIISDAPLTIYLKKIQETIHNQNKKCHLGLARIQYETQAKLRLNIKDRLITIHADFNLN